MQTSAQILKMRGELPDVELKDIRKGIVNRMVESRPVFESYCGHPDLPDPEIAAADPDTIRRELGITDGRCSKDEQTEYAQAIAQAHERLGRAGAGSWPTGCHDSLEPTIVKHVGNHACTMYVERQSFASHHKRTVSKEELDLLAEPGLWGTQDEVYAKYQGKSVLDIAVDLCVETYRRVGVAIVEVFTGKDGEHNIHVRGKNIPGSTIGFAYFNDGTCSDHVTCNIDNSYRPNLIGLTRLLCHELGHNMNLQHTFAGERTHKGIMGYVGTRLYYGFSEGSEQGLPRDPSHRSLERFFGNVVLERVGTPAPEPPKPPTTPSTGTLPDRLVINGRTYAAVDDGGGDPVVPF